jgi:hypothetical protein
LTVAKIFDNIRSMATPVERGEGRKSIEFLTLEKLDKIPSSNWRQIPQHLEVMVDAILLSASGHKTTLVTQDYGCFSVALEQVYHLNPNERSKQIVPDASFMRLRVSSHANPSITEDYSLFGRTDEWRKAYGLNSRLIADIDHPEAVERANLQQELIVNFETAILGQGK